MRETLNPIRQIMETWRARLFVGLPIAASAYQFGCDQFGWPTIPVLWGQTGAAMPWWGWLFLAQTGFVYALYEYVRRSIETPLPNAVLSQDLSPIYDDASIKEQMTIIDEKIVGLYGSIIVCTAEIEKLKDIVDKEKNQTRLSFHTLGMRDDLSEIESEILELAALLYDKFKEGETYDINMWNSWDSVHSRWDQQLKTWLQIAQWYAEGVKKRTLNVDDRAYGQQWSVRDNQFPDAEAVRRFKKFRIIHTQWLEVLPSVREGVRSVAFGGMSDRDVRNGNPAG